ncbi:sterol desaturase family protein [Paraflavitalea sp. CAU 1676]|uniref:sterol desaturase family protein n=1 Tax=Paraflavitalea sp. CAU 1676 TaxID=3032598 RepID=UPI0023DA1C76|nr:sterol desaturase family protein [Paraflavitalea sp. CAU 1676]MDF2193783.1 sterol desaturase family protein [Paraflavitalea sp. CAU 1676]
MSLSWKLLGELTWITFLRYFVMAGIPFVVFYIIGKAYFKRHKIQSNAARVKDFLREMLHSSISSFVLTLIACLVWFTPFRSYTIMYRENNGYPVWWMPVSVVLALIVHDTYFYWMHRALHHKSVFRFTHLTHHRSTNPSPWAAYSFNVLEAIAEAFIVVILAFVLPMNGSAVIWFSLASFVINVYGHLGYEIMPRSFRHSYWFGVFNTSVYHNLHHSKFKGNYGLYFRWWDRWMRTEHPDYVKQYDVVQEQRFGALPPKIQPANGPAVNRY